MRALSYRPVPEANARIIYSKNTKGERCSPFLCLKFEITLHALATQKPINDKFQAIKNPAQGRVF